MCNILKFKSEIYRSLRKFADGLVYDDSKVSVELHSYALNMFDTADFSICLDCRRVVSDLDPRDQEHENELISFGIGVSKIDEISSLLIYEISMKMPDDSWIDILPSTEVQFEDSVAVEFIQMLPKYEGMFKDAFNEICAKYDIA